MTKTYLEQGRIELDDGKYTVIRYSEGGGTVWLRHGEAWPAADEWRFAKAINALVDRCFEFIDMLDKKPPALAPVRSAPGGDGSVRKAHYGEGKQPWDVMLEKGWGPHFAAGCVIRYLRRDKAIEHSRESARWYYDQLATRAKGETGRFILQGPWLAALLELKEELTTEEKETLTCSRS